MNKENQTVATSNLRSVSNTRSGGCKVFKFWCITDYCENRHEWNDSYMQYYKGQQEICPTSGRKHWQIALSTIKKVN